MKVMKFGGSTIKNLTMIKRVGKVIKNTTDSPVVVVSALFGQTNEIREYIDKIRSNNERTNKEEISSFINKIRKRHKTIAGKLIADKSILSSVNEAVEDRIQKLDRLLYGVAYTEELTARTTDLMLSSAERMSAMIIEGVLVSNDVSAKAYEADNIGIVTDGIFMNATADLLESSKNLEKSLLPAIKKGTVPVITGFFGCDSKGRTTTFGKNGSDYSAAVIANAINAAELELWKDVNGFMSADPGIVRKAHTIDKLSYDEAAELAYFGISFLHPRTVGPVKVKNIPIVIKNILKPDDKGTKIIDEGHRTKNVIKSVVCSTELVEISVGATGAGYRSGVLSSVSKTLFDANINIYSVSTSPTHLSILIHRSDLKNCLKVLNGIIGGVIEDIDYKKDIALICVVGEGSRKTKNLAGKIFSAVSKAGVNVYNISAGASQVSVHFIVKKGDHEKTVRAIHSTFCEN
jgi:aspartate kinase